MSKLVKTTYKNRYLAWSKKPLTLGGLPLLFPLNDVFAKGFRSRSNIDAMLRKSKQKNMRLKHCKNKKKDFEKPPITHACQ